MQIRRACYCKPSRQLPVCPCRKFAATETELQAGSATPSWKLVLALSPDGETAETRSPSAMPQGTLRRRAGPCRGAAAAVATQT